MTAEPSSPDQTSSPVQCSSPVQSSSPDMSSNGNGANSGDVSSSHGSSGSHGETGSLPDSSRPDFSSGGEPVGPPAPTAANAASGPPTSFVKLAMRNMVRKGRQSLLHFGLTALGLMAFLVLIAWLGRPSLPQ